MIRFGSLSITLLIGVVQGAIVAALLLARRENRVANRLLAALILAFALRVVPFVIGYAGFYDAYPWLSFAPFAVTLLYGPLIYLYVVRITESALPRRWWAHLLPACVQAAYYTAIFVQPLPFKNWFDVAVHERWVDPVETVLTFASLGIYLFAAFRRYCDYRRWVDDATSDSARHALLWVRNFLIAFTLTTALSAGFDAWSAFFHRLNYFNYFGLYLWYAGLVYYLGMEGWRSAGNAFPQRVPASFVTAGPVAVDVHVATGHPAAAGDIATVNSAGLATSAPAPAPVDWGAAGATWLARVEAGAYWRDPELTLAKLAQQLGLSPGYVSRAVNDGLGQNFNEAINRMRVASVCARLSDGGDRRDILEIAFEAGFSSKASFNRCFKAYTGRTPSEFRRSAERTRLIS